MANNKGQITDDDNILDFLNLKNIEDKSDWSDPLTKSSVPITLDQLRPFHNNPRTTRNPNYDEIRDMIEARGLDSPPNISRRNPDDEYYIIIDGGNTRLEILRELYEKYTALAEQAASPEEKNKLTEKAQSFFAHKCVFKPWKSESDALAGHMCENEARGPIKLIEKAMAAQKFREIYAQEDKQALIDAGEELDDDYETPRLSTRELSRRMASQGWKVDQSHLTRFEYAASVLIGVIPEALWAGMGVPIVKSIRKYKKAYEDFWLQIGAPEQDKISEYFLDELHKFDGETLDFNAFIDFFNRYLADKLSMPVISVSAEVNALVNNIDINVPPELLQQSLQSSAQDDIAIRYQETRRPGETVLDPGPVATPSPALKQQQQSETNTGADSKAQTAQASVQASTQAQVPQTATEPAIETINNDAITGRFIVPDDLQSVWNGIINHVSFFAHTYDLMVDAFDINEFGHADKMACYVILNYLTVRPGTPDEQKEILVFEPGKDDDRAAIWWVLTRLSRSYKCNLIQEFIDGAFASIYQKYLPAFENNILAMTLFLEEKAVMLPDEIQTRLRETQQLTKQYFLIKDGL